MIRQNYFCTGSVLVAQYADLCYSYDRNRIGEELQSTVSLVFGDVGPVMRSDFEQIIKSFPDIIIGANTYELFGDVIARQLRYAAIRVNTSDFMGSGGGITDAPNVKCK